MAEKTNKLSIYLLKPSTSIEGVLRKDFQSIDLENGRFYYAATPSNPPTWVSSFFGVSLADVDLKNRSSKGVWFTEQEFEGETRIFALPFGYGHSMIDKSKCVDDFGLKVVLNVVNRKSIRKIGKRTLASDPKNTVEQLSKIGAISDFGIDIEQDLVEEITGQPKEAVQDIFGKNLVTGKVAFSISMKLDVEDIHDFLRSCKEFYEKDDYKDDFEFIDQVREIKSSANLNDRLIAKLKDDTVEGVQVWMAIPEIIEWENVSGFSFGKKSGDLLDDISLPEFKNSLTQEQLENITIDVLKRKRVAAIKATSDEEFNSWSVFQCLYCEITEADRTVILTNGKWYEIARDFVALVNQSYDEIMAASEDTTLLEAIHGEHENVYNERLAESLPNAIMMDRRNIRYGGGSSAVEFCDVFDADSNAFIHVKNYYGSSALSHLFAQGRVSGELFLNDRGFREKVKAEEGTHPFDENVSPVATDYSIVFGIISESENDLNLPFFSKVNLKNEKRQLRAFGFRDVFVTKIQRQKAPA
ncbi:DUF6119 family protein [Leisingera sp. ANG59]|uniref:DUF6119 family protein n=1 Tax=Leisingera sp. ANG59 TaxID=2675221 RepID=UPI00157240E7|nr:DUF6119 family protein [Leisingera sp. ANG59]NSY37551.1 hypothetical protein [Leisingera sp. ANG59]